jgi:phospholipid transport system transporter-binding protein
MTTLRTTPNGVMIEGELTVNVIPGLIDQGNTLIKQSVGDVTFDLSGVTHVDSASLALLIDWVRYAKREKKVLRFKHLPGKVVQMMKLSNLNL